ncbi:hypothetical protein [Jiulongibacter sp. NS-SX5]|uniref:hypothetical protein n=1 Tax=Jiulongibacter sp. NS-SX5 TaxID=3463854 RepID=UPI0040599D41
MKLLIPALLLLLNACVTGEVIPHETGNESNSVYYENAKLEINKETDFGTQDRFKIREGKKLVFVHFYKYEDNPQIADDEFQSIMAFELPADFESGTYLDNEILELDPFYGYSCYCVPVNEYKGAEGSLEITKLSAGQYSIKADFDFLYDFDNGTTQTEIRWDVKFDETFIEKK